ncbi:hypothetical protein CPB86DRAFT_791886 [Serendipita vermifera]|nr:hypothetical protein CPB86DRAFT_791886 [Serendipita vermifera]
MPPTPNNTLHRSCAECRRLKLKCDRNVPCGACVRRGCPSICPDGKLVAGKGSRLVIFCLFMKGMFILSNTQELHNKIEALQARIKDLEAALAQLQSKVTSEPHPLLVQSFEAVTEALQSGNAPAKNSESDDEDLVDTFGSLTIDPEGKTVWYGPHAGSEFLIPRKDDDPITNNHPELPVDILLLSKLFPAKSVHEAEDVVRDSIRSYLPPRDVAYESIYKPYSKLAWVGNSPTAWEDFYQMIFEPIYTPGHTANDQQIAVLFINMALSVLSDPTRPMYHPDSHRYYHLSRVSMSLGEDILHSHSLYAIQYLILFSKFNFMINDSNGPNRAWGALGLAIRLAQMVYRDNEQWDKYPEQAEYRRRLWWDLIGCETIWGFAMGRPRSIYPAYYDTKMPKDDEDEGKPPSFSRLRYRWVEVLGSVLDEAFAVKPPPYATILKLDKTVRDWDMGSLPSFDDLPKVKDSEVDPKALFQSLSTTTIREIALMHLHRRYFVEALTKRSNEPLRSKYAMSVLAVHRSATTLLQGTLRSSSTAEQIFATLSFIWLCLSAIVIKSPGCSLAHSSLIEIDRVKDALTAVKTYRVLHAKPIITKLYEQAHLAMTKYKEGKWSPDAAVDEVDADVMKFIGRSDFIPAKPQEAATRMIGSSQADDSTGIEAHPVLLEYLRRFENPTNNDAVAPSATSQFTTKQDVPPHDISGHENTVGIFDSHVPDRSSGRAAGTHGPNLHLESSSSTRWPPVGLYDNPSLSMDSLSGHPPEPPQQPFPLCDLLLYQGSGFCQFNEQKLQDQVWEQFLATLMPGEMSVDSSLKW